MEKTIDENKQGNTLVMEPKQENSRKLFIESYGCAMNFSDSEIVASILAKEGFNTTQKLEEADLVLVNTCSIREKAEQTVRKRLEKYNAVKKINPGMKVGVLGCMAERLKEKFLEEEKIVDLVVGPDAYKDLPNLINEVEAGRDAINVLLSKEETYGDIIPVRAAENNISAFISIMRGCNNMCSYCIVPYVRGRERSRDPQTILNETQLLAKECFKEITLLGQNVNSYNWEHKENKTNFSKLLDEAASKNPSLRFRFATSHPKDLSDEIIKTMAKHPNICKHIHLPVQSGSSKILKKMNRKYSREWYIDRIDAIKKHLPDAEITTDIMTGFCSETEEDHQETLSLMEYVQYDYAYMFKYSERPGTKAARVMDDDVPEETKKRRLNEIIDLQTKISEKNKLKTIGKSFDVLIEGTSKKSEDEHFGRNSQNQVVVFPKDDEKTGDIVKVKIDKTTPATLIGKKVQF